VYFCVNIYISLAKSNKVLIDKFILLKDKIVLIDYLLNDDIVEYTEV